MDVWIGVLGFVLFLGFGTAVLICISAIKRQSDIIIKSRLHHKVNRSEIVYANLGLVLLVVFAYFKYYVFAPAIICFVLFIVLTTKIQSGLTADGAVVGTTYLEWEFIKSYKLVDDPEDSNIIILKMRANRRQYIMVCERRDRQKIADLMTRNHVSVTRTLKS